MKKKLFLCLFFLIMKINLSRAVTLTIVGPCDSQPFSHSEELKETNVGALTVSILNKYQIPFSGSEFGISSIDNSPIGEDSVLRVSEEETRFYGWCFSINGVVPEVYPHEIPIVDNNTEIRWFFAYAHYLRGEWVGQCLPAGQNPPAAFCPEGIRF